VEKTVSKLVTKMSAHAGFDAALIEPARMQAIVTRRMEVRCVGEAADYVALVERDEYEHAALLDQLLVGETRFFRDARVFAALGKWLGERPAAVDRFRVLCAPCSTGEEAYSVAAVLQAAGFAAGEYEIHAIDLSTQALETARQGVYGGYTLRGVDLEHRNLVVASVEERWSVLPELRSGLHFCEANLALADALKEFGAFDLILCRNLLIYLNAEARGNLLASLHGALKPNGRLVVGTADTIPEMQAYFQTIKPASSFMLARRDGVLSAKPVVVPARRRAVAVMPAVVRASARTTPRRAAMAASAESLYLQAREFLAHVHLRSAERACRKALYLHPEHLPSLELLEKLWSAEPQSRRYRALTERLRRVQKAVGA
jgi:chemotaxis protein methyltransferase WspC